jgi:uncharacterized protein with HEPN domain
MFEEGFKRYNNVTILKIFGEATKDASVTYKTVDEKIPRFALIRPVCLESYTTISESDIYSHKDSDFKNSQEYLESVLQQFAHALKENLPVNLVIAVIKKGTNVEFVGKAEFC